MRNGNYMAGNLSNRGAVSATGGASPNNPRIENDFYATQPKTVRALLDVFEFKGSILEPACGMGHISKVLHEYYPNNEIVSTDLIDRGYGQGGVDFLEYDYGRKFDNIITNPPFALAKEFVYRGLELANDKVAFLLKIQFLEGKKRSELFGNTPLKYVYSFSERQATLPNGAELNPKTGKEWSTVLFLAWFIWEKGYEGEPILRWL